MNNDIDIVITYVDDNDIIWKDKFNKWKEKEIKEGTINPNSKQAFGEERIRNWEFTQYWFRAVEKNCPWVHKIFFICQNEEQIPTWLNLDNPKLKVIFHRDFIPHELLPTFNTTTIKLYINQISDLSDNYILCDDDYFFMNNIVENRFFKNNIPQYENNEIPFGYFYDKDEFLHMMNNCLDFERKYMTKDKPIKFFFNHLPEAHNKSFEKDILKNNYDTIFNAQKNSKFRYKTNLTETIYIDIWKIQNQDKLLEENQVYYNCQYIVLSNRTNFKDIKNKDMVCFNDTDKVTDFKKLKKKLLLFLKKQFPKKSSFEK